MRSLLLWLFCTAMLCAADDYWPLPFSVAPVPDETDSSSVGGTIRQVRDEGVYSGRTTIEYNNVNEKRCFSQDLSYHLDYDPQGLLWERFLGLPGRYMLKHGVLYSDYLGIEWKPGVFLDWGEDYELLESRFSAGPTVQYSPGGVPVQMSLGGAGILWNSDLRGRVAESLRKTSQTDLGGYAEVKVPGIERATRNSSVYFDGAVFAQTLGKSSLLLGSSQLVLRRGLESLDSLFAYCGDSVALGNESFFGAAGGEQRYISRPNEQRNNFGAGFGFRGKSRLMVIPSATLVLGRAVVLSSQGKDNPGNEKSSGQGLTVALESDTAFPVSYRGGFRVDWGKRDRLPGERFTNALPDTLRSTRSRYDLNTSDQDRFGARMIHQLGHTFPNGMGALYRFSLSRDSRTYPFSYTDQSGAPHDNDESGDIISSRHFWEITTFDKKVLTTRFQGEYRKTIINYVHERRSAVNTTDSTFMLGVIFRLQPIDQICLYDTTRIGADVTRYHFPGERVPNEGAPYSRSFLSLVRLELQLTPVWGAAIDWRERYDDVGRWYSTQYIDTTLLDEDQRFSNGYDYYGPETKTWEHMASFAVRARTTFGLSCEAGLKFDKVNQFLWESDRSIRAFTIDITDRGAALRPFLYLGFPVREKLVVDARVMPVFYVKSEKKPDGGRSLFVSESYFDMNLQVRVGL